MTKEKTILEQFHEKKQELKVWLYGTIYKQYDMEETAEIVQSDVDDHFTDEWFNSIISQAEDKRDQIWREKIAQAFVTIETAPLPLGEKVWTSDQVISKLYDALLSESTKENT